MSIVLTKSYQLLVAINGFVEAKQPMYLFDINTWLDYTFGKK
jgi:hypothetical protein